jgi:5-methyltetrahydropteroyltriglutamate--homocysteine methyltransferase
MTAPGYLAALPLLPTTVVGSLPQPGWLIDGPKLAGIVPRVRRADLWRVAPEHLAEACDDAVRLAVADLEHAAVDIVSDGEIRRESYSNHFLTALDGVDLDQPAIIQNRAGRKMPVPRIVGPVRRVRDVDIAALRHLRSLTTRPVKVTLPGPFTLAQQCEDGWYGDREALAADFAVAVNEEALALAAAGADVVQLDEPWYRNDPEGAARYAVAVLDRALAGVTARTVVHLCFGYAAVMPRDKPNAYPFLAGLAASVVEEISVEAAQPNLDLTALTDLAPKRVMLGVVDLANLQANDTAAVAARIRAGLRHVPAERLTVAPDCGMKYLRRAEANTLLGAMVQAARLVRGELAAAR